MQRGTRQLGVKVRIAVEGIDDRAYQNRKLLNGIIDAMFTRDYETAMQKLILAKDNNTEIGQISTLLLDNHVDQAVKVSDGVRP